MKAIVTLITFIFSQFLFAGDSLIFIIRVDDIQSRNTTLIPRSIFHFEEVEIKTLKNELRKKNIVIR